MTRYDVEYQANYRSTHREERRLYSRTHARAHRSDYYRAKNRWRKENPEECAKEQMLHSAKLRAKRKGITFDLKLEDLVIPRMCPVFPNLELRKNKGRQGDNSPSLDRIVPTKGYVKDNIWIISLKANRAKNNLTLEELKLLVVAIERVQQKSF